MTRRVLILVALLGGAILSASAQDSSWVSRTLRSMSLPEKIGQLFVVELVAVYDSDDGPLQRYALEMIRRYHVGSFLLTGGTVRDIAVTANRLQKASKLPLLINGDLESGLTYHHPWRRSRGWTERLPFSASGGGTGFPSQMAVGATGNPHYAYEMGRITALESRALGIHWTNSPVADVNTNPENPVINTRSFGERPALVSHMVSECVRGLQENGLIATVKHFPGHGDTREDSHMGLPSLRCSRERLDSVELAPFRAGIASGVKAVMTAHIALPSLDPSGDPSTLSAPVITGVLRESLHFDGIVVTDGMRMQGITDRYGPEEAPVRAIEAGVDAILGPYDIGRASEALLSAVGSRRIAEERIDASVRRILAAKSRAGLDRHRLVDIDRIGSVVGKPEFQAIAQEISDASVTLLRNAGGLIPLRPEARVHLVVVSEDPNPDFGIELQEALSRSVRFVTRSLLFNAVGNDALRRVKELSAGNDVTVVGIYLSIAAWKGGSSFSEPVRQFLDSLGTLGRPVVSVAFGDPYILGRLPETEAVLTPYNGSVLAERSVAKVLSGAFEARGKLPVSIPGRYPLPKEE